MEKKEKKLIRLSILIFLTTYIFLLLTFITNSIGTIEALQERFMLIRIALVILGMLGSMSIFYIWFKMLAHWHKAFTNNQGKLGWLALLLVLNVLGALVYYLIVIELKKDVNSGN